MNNEKMGNRMASSILQQNPHRVREQREKVLEVAIGREVRGFRRKQEITVAELSMTTGLSIGMLSKIENGSGGTKLETVFDLIAALELEIAVTERSKGTSDGLEDIF